MSSLHTTDDLTFFAVFLAHKAVTVAAMSTVAETVALRLLPAHCGVILSSITMALTYRCRRCHPSIVILSHNLTPRLACASK